MYDCLSKSASLCLAVIFLVHCLSHSAACGEEIDPSRFEKTIVQTNLVQPMELAIAPDGRIFFIELAGKVKLIDPTTGTSSVIAELDVTTEQENGLIGLALDPNFADNHWVYLQYSPPDFSGQHVSRFDFVDDKILLESEKVLLTYEEQRRECCHHAGSLEFGPDGCLYIGTGDNTNPFNDSEGYAPIDQREDREPWDAQRTSANTKNYNGKILRIKPEPDGTYSIPDGNLFPKDGTVGHPEIYVMGCRNPWRISVDQRSGFLYWGDVGPDAGSDGKRGPRGYDEINQARQAGFFGWPYFIGDNFAYSMVNFDNGEISAPQNPSRPMNLSVNNTGAKELPPAQPAMIYYPGSPTSEFPEVFSGGRTACAGPVYYYDEAVESNNKFPAAYDRTLFAFEWSRNWILAVHLDEHHKLQRLEPFLPHMSFVRPIDLQFDASGSLYVIEYGETWGINADAQLVRVDYVRGNRTPEAIARLENTVGREPLLVHCSATDSSDKDGDALTYEWTYVRSDDASQSAIPISDSATTDITFDSPGVYTIQLRVTDSAGASQLTSAPVIVGNARPEVNFVSPVDGDFYLSGEPIRYELVVTDIEDGTSDFDKAEEDGWHLIESHAPTRLFVEAKPASPQESPEDADPGLALMRKSDCFNCHATNRRLVGPSFIEIADKYRNDPHQLEKSADRVRNGSTGVWGKIGMLPHQQHTEAEVLQMVEYVFSVTADASNPTAQGFRNALDVESSSGVIILEATYTDLGRDEIPRLVGVAKVHLRTPKVQAESADEIQRVQKLNSDKAEGGTFIGAIEHDAFLKYDNIRLDNLKAVKASVTSAGAGGRIEVRRGGPSGELLGSVDVEVNGSWDAFHVKQVDLVPSTGRDTIFLVFKNEHNRGGLMNVDWVEFQK